MDMWTGPVLANVAVWGMDWLPAISTTGVFVTALVAYMAYRQALDAGRRDQWWARAQWAIDASLDPDRGRQLAGLTVLTSLKTSRLATRQDAELFDAIARSIQASLGGVPAQGQAAQGQAAQGPAPHGQAAPGEPAEEVAGSAELLRQAGELLRSEPPPEGRKPARSPISAP